MSITSVSDYSNQYGIYDILQRQQQRQQDQDSGGGFADQVVNNLMSSLDGDGNGSLSMSELSGTKMTEAQFDKLDTDGDGELSQDELKNGIQSKRDELMSKLQSMQSAASNSGDILSSLLQGNGMLQGLLSYQNQQDQPDLMSLLEGTGISLTA
ncbi:EF-Hand domain protein [Desulfovibrio sp. X2]|uniref:EF-Hand domain protein n=1 Tax=Desulfovibrio sp. X2 TaxID=941449 RepID=UPI00035877C3|nr:EF-Hand domain protein [Desulfovibrio sp. X2]EPR44504.1 EF-Hand domain protein [Desulfovibrio sp. X2]